MKIIYEIRKKYWKTLKNFENINLFTKEKKMNLWTPWSSSSFFVASTSRIGRDASSVSLEMFTNVFSHASDQRKSTKEKVTTHHQLYWILFIVEVTKFASALINWWLTSLEAFAVHSRLDLANLHIVFFEIQLKNVVISSVLVRILRLTLSGLALSQQSSVWLREWKLKGRGDSNFIIDRFKSIRRYGLGLKNCVVANELASLSNKIIIWTNLSVFFSRARKRMKVTDNVVQQLLTRNFKVMKIRRGQQRLLLHF